MSDSSNDSNFMEEWKVAREVLASFDDRLDNLRKYGFSFLTALLTADSILFPASIPFADKALPDEMKLAVLIVNLVLILALQFMDRNYCVYLQAAESRARVLESILNLEVTHVISQRHKTKHVGRYVAFLYIAFVAGVGIVGLAVFYVDRANVSDWVRWPFIAAIFSSIGFILYQLPFNAYFRYGKVDWIVYPLQCQVGGKVAIVATNLDDDRDIRFLKGMVIWEVKNEDGSENGLEEAKMKKRELVEDLRILHHDSYTWLWVTNGVTEGMYRVHRAVVQREHLEDVFGGHDDTLRNSFKEVIFHKKLSEIKIKNEYTKLEPLPRTITIVKAPKTEKPL